MSNRIKKQFWFTPEEEAEFRRKVALTGLPQSSVIRMLIKGYEPRERPDDRFFQAINTINEMIHTAQKLLERSYQLGVVDKDTVEREIKRWAYFISNIESHMCDKAVDKVKKRARELVKQIQFPINKNEEYKAISVYNAYVSGVHNYYRFATHISKDFRKIAFGVTRTMKNRLRNRLQTQGNPLPKFIAERYSNSKQIRYVNGQALIPIGYVQTKAPLYKRREVNQYTVEGRKLIHKSLEAVNIGILHYLMRNPIQYASVELNNNRLALYCAQHGCCAITKRQLEIGSIHCHHKEPKRQGGDDRYSNLVLISEDVHVLVHATDNDVITKYMHSLKLNAKQKAKLNTLRKKAGLFLI